MTAAAPLPVEVTHRTVLGIALPMTLAHLTTPLIGFVDLAVIGQLGDPALIGAVALGAVLFDFLFWPLGFLRMGTAGLTAQALGARYATEQTAIVLRAAGLALLLGAAALLLREPIASAGLWLLGGTPEVQAATRTYVEIRLWGAPLTLMGYVLLGWLIGLGRTGLGLALQILINASNMALSAGLTLGLGWGLAGVAWGTVLAEAIGLAAGGLLVAAELRRAPVDWRRVADKARLKAMLGMNRDIMIRSFALLAGFLFFARQGAAQGDVVVAANGLLMNLFLVGAYVLDGFATSVEQIGGRAVGARNPSAFRRAARLTLQWSAGYGIVLSLALFAAGGLLIDMMTTAPEVRTAARAFLPFAAAAPLVGALAFHQDGLYIGAGWTRAMRDMMVLSFAIFVAAWAVLAPAFGNTGLWVAFLVFLAARGITLAAVYGRERDRTFGAGAGAPS